MPAVCGYRGVHERAGRTRPPPPGSPLEPAGRKLLRLEVRNSQVPIERKPEWIKTRLKTGPEYTELKSLVRREGLHTVCEEAGCPNIYECWEDREATFLIGGDQCTRRCDFCQIDTGKPADFDADEPRRVAESVATMGLKYATITGVARDDLPDGGAWLYAETVRQIHAQLPGCGVELLIPDFNAEPDQLAEVFSSRPEVLAHNVETVPRIFKRIRPGFRFDRSLSVITAAREAGLVTKSNLILGMGEEPHEVVEAMQALHDAGLRPAHDHPVPAPLPAAPPRRPLGEAGGVRRVPGRRRADRLPGRARRAAGPQLLPRRPALPAGDRGPRGHPVRLTLGRPPGAGGTPVARAPILWVWHAASPQTPALRAARPDALRRTPGGDAVPAPRRPGPGGEPPKLDRKGRPKEPRLKKITGQARMIKQAYTLTRKNDPKLPWIMLIAFVVAFAVVELLGILFNSPFLFLPLAIITRRPGRARGVRAPGAGLGVPPGRGAARCGRVGARGHAR